MKNIIRKFIPKSMLSVLKYMYCFPRDAIDSLLGRREPLIPPTRLMFDGPRDVVIFKKNGEEYLRYYKELCGLKPSEKILDVGCGVGRKAVPLINYLDENGRYEGFDIAKKGIDWCQKRISNKNPNFHFQLVDVYNKTYNPKGRHKASEFKFPFGSEYFDFIVLGSVFTHMLPDDMENYLSEIARVLKKGGRSLISFHLLNKVSLELIDTKKSTLDFKYDMGKYRTINPNVPEDSVSYDESFISSLYDKKGMKIKEPVYYGAWSGRQGALSYQDIVIAIKK